MTHAAVVCVDDEVHALRALHRSLRREPYDVIGVRSARAAINLLRSRPVDVIISDQRMPDMTGTELMEVVRRVSPETRRVILTAYPTPDLLRSPLADRVVAKPWVDEGLRDTVRTLMREPRRDPGAPGVLREILVETDCRGADDEESIRACAAAFEFPVASSRGVAVALNRIAEYKGDVARLIRRLAERADAAGVPATLLDASGRASDWVRECPHPMLVEAPTPCPGRSALVLCSDNDAAARIATAMGMRTIRAGDADEAVASIDRDDPDVVVVDLDLPRAAAYEVMSRNRRLPLEVRPRLLAYSRFRPQWRRDVLARLGIDAILQRPFPAAELIRFLRGD